MKKLFLTIFLFVTLLSAFPEVSFSATENAKYDPVKIFYFREGKNARASLFAHGDAIEVLAPQSYSFGMTGDLKGGIQQDILDFTKKHGIKVMPLITNTAFNKAAAHAFLDSTKEQDKAIQAMLTEAKKNNYWGWQVDFEQVGVEYKEEFSHFIERMAKVFKKNGLVTSVAVVSKISDKPSDYPKDLWNKLIGVYDYKELAKHVDFLSIMSYDDPYSDGPVTQYSWLQQVMTYTLTKVPKEKISMGIPFYYWQWDIASGKIIGIGGNEGIQNVFKKYKYTSGYDPIYEAAYLQWWSKGKNYLLWYDNEKSMKKKIDLMKSYGLHGFSAWALGLELPEIYKALSI